MTQQYSLRWNNHQPNFISMFTSLLNTQTLVDVTLAAEGKHLQAHKVVLSACSNYFQALFMDNPSRHPIVILKDVTFADLRTMVDFMYYGEVHVTEEQLPQVLDTAKTLKIKGLTEMPDSTSVTRSQGTSADFPAGDPQDPQRHLASPVHSPRRRKRRRSSTGSLQMSAAGEDGRLEGEGAGAGGEEAGRGAAELVRADAITLSSVPRRRDYHDPRAMDAAHHQAQEAHNLNVEQLGMEANAGIPQGGQWSVMDTYGRYGACGVQEPVFSADGLEVPGDFAPLGAGPSCPPAGAPPEPPPPPPARRRRTANPQAEENFQRALEAVRFGGIGFCKAARMFGVNNRTLWLEYKKKGYPNTRPSIKSRIKREHATPPPALKEEPPQQMALVCPPHAVPVGFVDSRPLDFQQESSSSSSGLQPVKLRRSKYFKRQSRVQPEDAALRKQASEPARALPAPPLQKHESYPQYSHKSRRVRTQEHEMGSLLIRAVTVLDRHAPSTSGEGAARASHTPAVRSGPPLSCNFCWNTVDECGRILRRKTQYHCPECRTNLCIVPCFHEYHDGPEPAAAANAR